MNSIQSSFRLFTLCLLAFGCTASTETADATRDDVVLAVAGACEVVVTCSADGTCGDSQSELVDSVTRQSNGSAECEALLFEEYVVYFDCLAALSCEEIDTNASCEDAILQDQIDTLCAP